MAKKEEKVREEPREEHSILATIGPWAFIAGLCIAILTTLVEPTIGLIAFLAVIGLIVGLLNITEAEVSNYLLACIAFIVSTQALQTVLSPIVVAGVAIAPALNRIVTHIIVFIAPGAAIVALKALYSISKD